MQGRILAFIAAVDALQDTRIVVRGTKDHPWSGTSFEKKSLVLAAESAVLSSAQECQPGDNVHLRVKGQPDEQYSVQQAAGLVLGIGARKSSRFM